MGTSLRLSLTATLLALAGPDAVAAGKYGFADKPGGGQNDPVIQVSAFIGPGSSPGTTNGAVVSLTEEQANALYKFDSGQGVFQLSAKTPTIPQTTATENQWIRIKFPMDISSAKIRKTLMKNKAALIGTSFLTPNISITDEGGTHIEGIPVINGRTAQNKKVFGPSAGANGEAFPLWLDSKGKNLLVGKKIFTYVATVRDLDVADQEFISTAAFGGTTADPLTSTKKEIRIRLQAVGGVEVNGFWVIKIGDNSGDPLTPVIPLTISTNAITALDPVTPTEFVNMNQVVEPFTKFLVEYSEPIVPSSMGFSAKQVSEFNASNPVFPMFFNGNTGVIPNPDTSALNIPIYPAFRVTASAGTSGSSFVVPFNVRPINPNNLAQYIVNPIIDVPGDVDVTLKGLDATTNLQNTGAGPVPFAASSLYRVQFDQPNGEKTFHTNLGRAWVNVPVAPQAIYFSPLAGGGIGAINLDGNGFETNDPAVKRLLILTNGTGICACLNNAISGFFPGPSALGCNPPAFGDQGVAGNSIGIGGNPPGLLGGPTPVPGVNEGSEGSTANGSLGTFGLFPRGFETVCRDSRGNARLQRAPEVGSVGDIQVGDFLDTLFYDRLNPAAQTAVHGSLFLGVPITRNSISDPPVPNPPPLRLPVGLPPVDIVYDQQKLLKPAFVIIGAEPFPNCPGAGNPYCVPNTAMPPIPPFVPACPPTTPYLLLPDPFNPVVGDHFPVFAQNGPAYQTHGSINAFAARQQIGNFLYVTDRDENVVKVLNSNTFSVLDKIETPDPEGLGLTSDLRFLYVSNFGNDSVSIIGTNPFAGGFHTELTRIPVGSGPRAVSAQADGEDVFVANYLGNSVSIIDLKSQTVRNTLTDSVKRPWEVITTPRQSLTGWLQGTYNAFIANQGTGEINVYESGPTGTVGADAIRWKIQASEQFFDMRGMTYDPFAQVPGVYTPGFFPGGVYITHRDLETGLAVVSRGVFTEQKPAAGILPPQPFPGTILNSPGAFERKFAISASWGGPLVPFEQKLNLGGQDQTPYDVALNDFTAKSFYSTVVTEGYQTNIGASLAIPTAQVSVENGKHPYRVSAGGGIIPTYVPDRLYISFPGDSRIVVVDPAFPGVPLNVIENAPVVGSMATYFDQ